MSYPLRIAIVCEHASLRFGGEAAVPLHIFRILRERGFNVWLVCHSRTRTELADLFPGEERIHYVEDTAFNRLMSRIDKLLPADIAYTTSGFLSRLFSQLAQRRLVKALVKEHSVNVVHQPIPVSPKEPSLLYGLGAPVVIGPMNGGIDYPPPFKSWGRVLMTAPIQLARALSGALNWLIPGKRHAAILLVANDRTRKALPYGASRRIMRLPENGVDLALWTDKQTPEPRAVNSVPTFVFIGRLVDWKGVDYLVQAFHIASQRTPMSLIVAGEGPEREKLMSSARKLGLLSDTPGSEHGIHFSGWLTQASCAALLHKSDALILPSLRECGGAVVLEAMAAGKPVIATAWGGPADYLDESCGILVPPSSPRSFTFGLANAMIQLASSAQTRDDMGRHGLSRVQKHFDWDAKIDSILSIYHRIVATPVQDIKLPPTTALFDELADEEIAEGNSAPGS